MGEAMRGSVAGPINAGVYLEIDPTWLAHNAGYPLSPMGKVLHFFFVDLEDGIEESVAVNYADFEIIGRAESYKSFIGAGNREFPLNFKFRVQGVDYADPVSAIYAEVMDPTLWLDGLKQPWTGSDGLSHAPPPCILSLGNLFFGRVVVTDVQFTWQPPFEPDTFLPHGSDVACTFTVVREHIRNYSYGVMR